MNLLDQRLVNKNIVLGSVIKNIIIKLAKQVIIHFYSCPDCGERTKLDFFPKRNQKMWDELICPNCGEPRKNTELI